MRWIGLVAFLMTGIAQAGTTVTLVRNKYSVTTVGSTSYVQLVSGLTKRVSYVDIFSSSNSGTVLIAVGAAGFETNQLYVHPSTNKTVPLVITKGARVSIKSVDATISLGDISLSFIE